MTTTQTSYFCPHCGNPGGQPIPGEAGEYECLSCKGRFAVTPSEERESPAPALPAARAQTLKQDIQRRLAKAPKWHFVALALLGIAVVQLPKLLRSRSQPPAAVEQKMGRLERATVFDNGGKISFIELYKDRNGDMVDFVIRVTDMQTGKRLSEPLRVSLAPSRFIDGGEFKQFSDGQLYLTLQERQVLRFDAGAQQFVEMTNALPERFGQELGGGISKLKFAYADYRDSFEVTTREGMKYLVFWPVSQILPYDGFGHIYEKAVADYSQSRPFYRFAPVDGSGAEKRYQLIQYTAKTEPGKPLFLRYFGLSPRVQGLSLLSVGNGYFVAPYLMREGLLKIEFIPPIALRFDAEILAQNDKRLLLAYNSTPGAEDGRVLQLMDKSTHQVVWSRTAEQIPQLAQSNSKGRYTVGTALPSGFYLAANSSQPSLFIDNDGNTVHDFVTSQSPQSSASRR